MAREEGRRRRFPVTAMIGLIAFAAFGTFLIYGAGGGMLIGSTPSTVSPIILAGALCLLAAAYFGVVLLGVSNGGSWKRLTAVASPGIVILVLAPFIPFPLGCNLETWFNPSNVSHGCPASPFGLWSTVWPNVLLLNLGLLFATMGLASRRDRSPVVGAGMGLIMGGLVLIAFGESFGYVTSCPANGCLPLTGAAWWSMFWPNVLAMIIGAGQVLVGGVVCFTAAWRPKSRPEEGRLPPTVRERANTLLGDIQISQLPSAAEAFGAGRHLPADFAFLKRVVVLVKAFVFWALHIALADEHAMVRRRSLASKACVRSPI